MVPTSVPTSVLVTRPAAEGEQWVRALAAEGIAAEALPLIDIVPEPDGPALAEARTLVRQRWGEWDAVMFVSGNAVRGFSERFMPLALDGQTQAAIKTRAWSPGPGTTAALVQAGWPVARIDEPAQDAAQFDSEALWQRVAAQVRPGMRVLIVRGGDATGRPAGRVWLAEQLRSAGALVEQVVAYRRQAPVAGAWCQRAARAASDGSLWLFSSSQAVVHLRGALGHTDFGAARALCTHPRIALAARAAGFGDVRETHPTLEAVIASIKSTT